MKKNESPIECEAGFIISKFLFPIELTLISLKIVIFEAHI